MCIPALSPLNVDLTLDGNAGPVMAIKGVSLNVERGKAMASCGPSGSGKSSLLMHMSGLEEATAGRIVVLDHDLSE